MEKRAVLDVDGVTLDFTKHFAHVAEDVLQRPMDLSNNKLYDMSKRLGMTPEEDALVWKVFGDRGEWKNLPPFPGAEEAVQAIIGSGYDIYIVTGIEEVFRKDRLENLQRIGLLPSEIHCVGTGRSRKDMVIRSIDPAFFVDDRLEHLHMVPEVRHLAWIDHGEEQHPMPGGRVDSRAPSLAKWVDEHLYNITKGLHQESAPVASPKKLRMA